jgi:hypothetical protein
MGEDQITTILLHFDTGFRDIHDKIDKKFDTITNELRLCQNQREEFHGKLQPVLTDAGQHTGCAKNKKLRREKIVDQCKGALIMLVIAILLKYFLGIVI